jgi:hypothetical protein
MKKVVEAWCLLPESEKAKYHARSATEFKAQWQSLFQNGIHVRERSANNQPPPGPQPSNQDLIEFFQIGPYAVKSADSSKAVLGGGTYSSLSAKMVGQSR